MGYVQSMEDRGRVKFSLAKRIVCGKGRRTTSGEVQLRARRTEWMLRRSAANIPLFPSYGGIEWE